MMDEQVVTVVTNSSDPEYRALMWRCTGCGEVHLTPVNGGKDGRRWTWDGSLTAPTLSPSILKHAIPEAGQVRCHSFVRSGIVEFLGDCDHPLAGKIVPMQPYNANPFGGDDET